MLSAGLPGSTGRSLLEAPFREGCMCTGGCLQVQLGKPLLISWAQKAACLAPWPLLVLNCMRNQVAWQSGRLCSGC